MSAKEAAKGRWREILFALGVNPKILSGKHTACPFCRAGRDRFRFNPKTESGLWICNQCGGGDGFSFLMQLNGWDFKMAKHEVDRVLGHGLPVVNRPKPEDELPKLRSIWNGARPIGDLVRSYLFSRGIDTYSICCLRETDNAMVAMVTDAKGDFTQIHRTFLPSTKRLFGCGPITDGAAVRLMQRERGSVLGVAEGIETSLSAAELFGVPVWAALNATLLRKWTPPDDVREVIIFADNDANYTGQSAAFALANTLSVKGLSVRIEIPDVVGEDWNDVLIREKSLVKDKLIA